MSPPKHMTYTSVCALERMTGDHKTCTEVLHFCQEIHIYNITATAGCVITIQALPVKQRVRSSDVAAIFGIRN